MNNKERKIIRLQNKFDAFDDAFNNLTMDYYEYKTLFNKKTQRQMLNSIHKLRHKLTILTKDVKNTYFVEMEDVKKC